MSEFKGTRGEAVLRDKTDKFDYYILIGKKIICYSNSSTHTDKTNMNLIVDAFKVRQQINCELSELLEQNKEMLQHLEDLLSGEKLSEMAKKFTEQLIKKVKNNGI